MFLAGGDAGAIAIDRGGLFVRGGIDRGHPSCRASPWPWLSSERGGVLSTGVARVQATMVQSPERSGMPGLRAGGARRREVGVLKGRGEA